MLVPTALTGVQRYVFECAGQVHGLTLSNLPADTKFPASIPFICIDETNTCPSDGHHTARAVTKAEFDELMEAD